MAEEWVNPHDGSRHVYMGRYKERCECCGTNVVWLECSKCDARIPAPKAREAGWMKYGHRRERQYWDREIPDTIHSYLCPECQND